MGKRLILILVLAFVAIFTVAAYAEVQNVKVSGDLTAYGISRNFTLQGRRDDRTENAMASIARVKVDADLTDNVVATTRLLNERYWGNEIDNSSGTGADNTEIVLDLAYATMKEFLYSPLTLSIGRQELHFGNDMIVGDPDTNNNASARSPFGTNDRDKDLSARKAFDAVRVTVNYDPLVVDGIAALVSDTDLNTHDDVNLYGINVGYDLGRKNTKVEGYWFEKRTGRQGTTAPTAGRGKIDRVDVVGGRISTQPIENLTYQFESAYQFGRYVPTTANPTRPAVDRKAWALETMLNYVMPKMKMTPSMTALYGYFSGDHFNQYASEYNTLSGAYRAWDPMFENQTFGDIANALFNMSNVHLVGANLSLKPVDDVTLKGEYFAYWWAREYPDGDLIVATARDSTMGDGGLGLKTTGKSFAGQEIDATVTYDYTEDVQFALKGGWFIPGTTFKKDNDSTASEVLGSMKVTF